MLKGFLKWLNTKTGYTVPAEVLNFETNLKVLPKTVTFLHYDELLHFAHFRFKNDENSRLSKARDFWCFMAFTSLRVSDLKRLKVVHIHDGKIEMFAKKTSEHLIIPLIEEAQRILTLYNICKKPDDYVFDVQSSQKLNDAVKDAAKEAGLDAVGHVVLRGNHLGPGAFYGDGGRCGSAEVDEAGVPHSGAFGAASHPRLLKGCDL